MIVYCVLNICHIDALVIGVSVFLFAMFVRGMLAMLILKCSKDVNIVSKWIVISTVLSLITLSVISSIIS